MKHASAGLGGTPVGRSSNFEQRDKSPPSHRAKIHFPTVCRTSNVDNFILETRSAYTQAH